MGGGVRVGGGGERVERREGVLLEKGVENQGK